MHHSGNIESTSLARNPDWARRRGAWWLFRLAPHASCFFSRGGKRLDQQQENLRRRLRLHSRQLHISLDLVSMTVGETKPGSKLPTTSRAWLLDTGRYQCRLRLLEFVTNADWRWLEWIPFSTGRWPLSWCLPYTDHGSFLSLKSFCSQHPP